MTAEKCPGCEEGDGPCTCYDAGRAQALADFRASIDGQHPKDCTCQPCSLMRTLNLDPAEVRTWDLKLDPDKAELKRRPFPKKSPAQGDPGPGRRQKGAPSGGFSRTRPERPHPG